MSALTIATICWFVIFIGTIAFIRGAGTQRTKARK